MRERGTAIAGDCTFSLSALVAGGDVRVSTWGAGELGSPPASVEV
jgi:hypothetical protein